VPDLRAASTRIVADLNAGWRVVDNPPHWAPQWILQFRKGRQTAKSCGWRDRSYCTDRKSLLRCIREYCSEIDPEALVTIRGLPERHPGRC